MAAVQQMRERMTGIHCQWRAHWKNFLQKITVRRLRALYRQFRDLAHKNPVFRQLRQQFILPKRILRRHQFAHRFLDAIENFGGAQSVRTDAARLALNLLLIPATRISKNSSKFELTMVRNLTRSMSGCR